MSFQNPQTTVTRFPEEGMDGQRANTVPATIVTKLANVACAAGRGMVSGASWQECKLPTGTTDVSAHFQGVSILDVMREPISSTVSYAVTDAVPVMRRGQFYFLPQGDVVDDGLLYCVHSGADTGKFRGDTTTATLVPTAKVVRGATVASGLLAIGEINLP